ncbi:MAG TPA: Ig-like domain repeat protein [Edaphobacter sp.]|nr:Ig-like domain repeat protein [Edaphobacter sp.]
MAYAKVVSSVAISPQGAVLNSGSTQQFSAACSYSDGSTDNCAAAGGATWATARPADVSVDGTGLAKWISTSFPGTGIAYTNLYETSWVIVSAGGKTDRAGVFGQFSGDTWIPFMSPSSSEYTDGFGNFIPMTVAVGSTVTIGAGFGINHNGNFYGGFPMQATCSWTSSDPTKATVDRQGLVTALAEGQVTITCGRAGDAVWGTSNSKGWMAPGNAVTLNIVAGQTGTQTWYVRPGGGTPYVNSSETPVGQCDGKHDADYPGSGVNQPCAMGNLRDLWADGTTQYQLKWMISGGDTVIVRQKPGGYTTSVDALGTGGHLTPINCDGNQFTCHMPSVPSGTAAYHTKILGENYASCHSDSAKTLLDGSWNTDEVINTSDSQFVDVACFDISDRSGCGLYAHACAEGTDKGVKYGLLQSALTSNANYTDLFIHGTNNEGIRGASGVGVVADHIHIRGTPGAGIDMDDTPWGGLSNMSVAGGLTLTNSLTEFVGCLEEYPIAHNYPYIECVDSNTGGYGDGFATGSTVGDWVFDHDIWRANFQDGLDLLHSGMSSLTVTNSSSYANEGQAFKIGSAQYVIFRNNTVGGNCMRPGFLYGDEPASALDPGGGSPGKGYSLCRGGADTIPIKFDDQGTYILQNNSIFTYGVTFDMMCDDPWSHCENTSAIFQNNVIMGYQQVAGGQLPVAFYLETVDGTNSNMNTANMPPMNGWSVRDHNLYYNMRNGNCPSPQTGESCNKLDPKFVNEAPNPYVDETALDNFNFTPAASSPLIGAGISIPGLLADATGLLRPLLPSIGAIEVGTGSPVSTPSSSQFMEAASPSSAESGQAVVITASAVPVDGVIPTGSISFLSGSSLLGTATINSAGVATLSLSTLAPGTYGVTASYFGDANYAPGLSSAIVITVRTSTIPPPVTTTPPPVITVPPPVTTAPPPITKPPPVTSKPPALSVKIGQPDFGFNVIPGSTRRIFATVTNGTTNQVAWSVKSGSAEISSTLGPWIDVTAPANGSSCSYTGTSAQYGVSSATQFIIEAASVDDRKKTATATFNVCDPAVEVSIVPFYRTLYASQPADVQSLVLGSVNQNVHWAITSQPRGGDGKLTDSTSRDTLFTGTVAGRYQLTATSVADSGKSATAIMYVTGHEMPYRVTPNQTEPVDCTVDPSMLGSVYEVGPSQTFKTLASVPFSTIAPGSTVRLHNEDTTGLHPTVYHEYLEISQPATAEQPFRMCGVSDTKGNLPIIDGQNASDNSDTGADADGYGLLTIHNPSSLASWPQFVAAQYVTVEGIQFRNARHGYSYGEKQNWQNSAACIHIREAQNAAFVGNDIGGCGNGVVSDFNSSGGWGSSDLNILWEGNHIHNNGIAGSNLGHQMYLESWDNVVQFNRIDNYTSGAMGANIKSRGLQDIFRYNYLGDGAQREMDLVDVKDAPAYMSFAGFLGGGANSFRAKHSSDNYPADQIAAEQEAWNSHFVYGNIYRNSTSNAPIHFSMDTSGGELARKGSLYWYNNTFYQTVCATCAATSWTLFDTTGGNGKYYPQTEFQTVEAYNNVIWMNNTTKRAFQWNNYSAFIGVGAGNLLPSNWGSDLMTGGIGSGWNTNATTDAYQNSLPLDLHVTGFDKSDIATMGSIPFDSNSLTLASPIAASQSVPSAVCEMPTRFAYLINLGYAVPRIATPNVGATDTVAETADLINQTAGSGRYNTRYSNCH